MKADITNTSKAEQGVYTTDGLKFIAPGQTRTLTIADDYVERAKSLPFLTIGETHPTDDTLSPILTGDGSGVASDPLDHDGDGEKGGAHAPTGEGYDALTVPQLKELAAERGVDLGDAKKRDDIVATLELADEAAANT